MRRFIFIYARSDSSRLPGKAMMRLAGQRLVDIVIARARRVGADGCALLTSSRAVDDGLAAHCGEPGVKVVRGHATDLVSRSVQALDETQATHFLRVNADSPFFAPELACFAMEHLGKTQMISNLLNRRFPYGVAVEWMEAGFFRDRAATAEDREREHVTQHLYRQIDSFATLSLTQTRDDSFLRLAIDTAEDHARLTELVGRDDVLEVPYWESFGFSKPEMILAGHERSTGRLRVNPAILVGSGFRNGDN